MSIGGGATLNIATSLSTDISGITQTVGTGFFGADGNITSPVGLNAGNLFFTVQVRGLDTLQSPGFSVAAIPVDWVTKLKKEVTTIIDPKSGREEKVRGIIVLNSWQSDSMNLDDLVGVQRSEVIEDLPGTGIFAKRGQSTHSAYSDAAAGATYDFHTTPLSWLTGKGMQLTNQLFVFDDTRTGAQGVVAPNSGFQISRVVTRNAKRKGLTITTSKVGMAVTVNNLMSKAASGSASATQKV